MIEKNLKHSHQLKQTYTEEAYNKYYNDVDYLSEILETKPR